MQFLFIPATDIYGLYVLFDILSLYNSCGQRPWKEAIRSESMAGVKSVNLQSGPNAIEMDGASAVPPLAVPSMLGTERSKTILIRAPLPAGLHSQ